MNKIGLCKRILKISVNVHGGQHVPSHPSSSACGKPINYQLLAGYNTPAL